MGVYMMVMKIVSKNSFKVVGILVESDWRNIHKKMREAWSVFKERVEEIKERKGDYYFDISLAMEEDLFRQLICVEVSNFNDIPVGMTGKVIPAANYIYYQHKGPVENIAESFGKIYQWAEENAYSTDDFKIDYGYSDDDIGEVHDLYLRVKDEKI